MTTYALIIEMDTAKGAPRCRECIFNRNGTMTYGECFLQDDEVTGTYKSLVKDCPLINMDVLKRQLIDTMYKGVKKANDEMAEAMREFETELLCGRGYIEYMKSQGEPPGILADIIPQTTREKVIQTLREKGIVLNAKPPGKVIAEAVTGEPDGVDYWRIKTELGGG